MDLKEKAKIRIEHWKNHTADHISEYERFADALENSGYSIAARSIREMAALTSKCSPWLEKALQSMQES